MNNFTKAIRFALLIFFLVGAFTLKVNAQNNALDFDGIDDYVEVPFNGLLTSVKTIEVWAKVNANNTEFQSIVTSRGQFNGFAFYAAPNDTLIVMGGDGTGWITLNGPAISYGTWTHLAATYDGAALRFYVNGVAVDSAFSAVALPNAGSPLRIGAGDNEGSIDYFFGGQVDEARLWDTVLTEEEIAANMNTKLTGAEPGLVAYYNFDEGVPNGDNTTPPINTLTDLTANHLDGTLNNFTLNGAASNWVSSAVVLPINLVSFNATKNAGANLLQWSTASEQNSSYFEIQRGADGVHFTGISRVSAAGNSSNTKTYQFTDNQFSSLSPIYYYRLKMVDRDGSSKYSSVVFLKNSGGGSTTVYPNPARDKITINVTDKSLINSQACLSDVNGKVLQRILIKQSATEINISNYLKGIYILKLADGKSIKLVKE